MTFCVRIQTFENTRLYLVIFNFLLIFIFIFYFLILNFIHVWCIWGGERGAQGSGGET